MPTSSTKLSELHEGARQWASLGFFVFPCRPDDKKPAIDDWQNQATDNLDQIDRWWTDNPYNIGVVPARSGMFVLDQDGTLGGETLARLEGSNQALPNTLTVQTPRGPDHKHFWFRGSAPSTVAKLGPKLDTRGENDGKYGYVLVPPSRTPQGDYKTVAGSHFDIGPAPAWISAALATQHTQHKANPDAVLDDPGAIIQAIRSLENRPMAFQGQGCDAKTLQAVHDLRDMGISAEKTYELMRKHYRCQPQDERYETFLRRKVANGFTYFQNEAGSKAATPFQTEFAHYAVPLQGDLNGDKVPLKGPFYPMRIDEIAEEPKPDWLLSDLLPEKGLIVVYGKRKSFKTYLTLDMVLGIATGTMTYNRISKAPVDIVYCVGEGQWNLSHQSVPAWCEARGVHDLSRFYHVKKVPNAINPEETEALIADVKSRGLNPGIVVLDTMARGMAGLDENSSKDVGLFRAMCDHIREKLNCAVIVLRHSGLSDKDRPRGIGVLEDAADTVIQVERWRKTMLAWVTVKEQRNAQELEEPFYFQGMPVKNGLAFFPISQKTFRDAINPDRALGHGAVTSALRSLGALSEAKAVTTRVLATQICPQVDSDTAETYDRAVKVFVKELKELAKGKLQAFVIEKGRDIAWYIPAQSEATDDQF